MNALPTEPFRVEVPDAVLSDLRERLARARFPDQLEDVGWEQGTELGFLKQVVDHWRHRYDWRAVEARINAMPQAVATIDGLRVHFVHARSPHPGALPLVISHGWPGSIYEFHKIVGPLVDPVAHGGRAEDAFHVVAPSLPGFGWSEKPRTKGWTPQRIGVQHARLMRHLGYDRFVAQGGDWGATIASCTAMESPDACVALHVNLVAAFPKLRNLPCLPFARQAREALASSLAFFKEEGTYRLIQQARPQSLGYALNDSPVGLAGWILEKYRSWSDCDGDPLKRFTLDELVTFVMIYWVTETATSSARLYWELAHGPDGLMPKVKVRQPTAAAIFPKEVYRPPRAWATDWNVVRWTEMPRGGHFAALEEPELLVDDLRAFFRAYR